MNRSFITKATAVATLSLGAVVATASTASAQGTLNFGGSARVQDQPGSGGANLLIDFLQGTPATVAGTPIGTVLAEETISGDFESIAVGQSGTIEDLVFSNSGLVGTSPSFLTLGGYTFSITGAGEGSTFGPITLSSAGPNTVAFFSVTGRVFGGDFGATGRAYDGVFTAQFSRMTPTQVFNAINSGGTLPVAFSAEFSVGGPESVVPEPSTYALLATGLGALGMVARRRRQA